MMAVNNRPIACGWKVQEDCLDASERRRPASASLPWSPPLWVRVSESERGEQSSPLLGWEEDVAGGVPDPPCLIRLGPCVEVYRLERNWTSWMGTPSTASLRLWQCA
jgi:hypothetical protein